MSINVLDAAAVSTPLKTTINSGTHTPHQNIDSVAFIDTTASATLGAAAATVSIAVAGKSGVGFQTASGTTLIATLTPKYSCDGGTRYAATSFYDPTTGLSAATLTVASGTQVSRSIIVPGGASHVQVEVTSWTSGSATGTLRASEAESLVGLLATIAANQAVPTGGPKFGYVGPIGTGSNVTFASKSFVRGCVVTNLDATNNLLISIGTPGATDVDTYTVKPGRDSPFIPCTNANGFNMRSSASTVSACYAGS